MITIEFDDNRKVWYVTWRNNAGSSVEWCFANQYRALHHADTLKKLQNKAN